MFLFCSKQIVDVYGRYDIKRVEVIAKYNLNLIDN